MCRAILLIPGVGEYNLSYTRKGGGAFLARAANAPNIGRLVVHFIFHVEPNAGLEILESAFDITDR